MVGGTAVVAVGLTVTGLATIVMMALSARSLIPEEYAAFAVWWTVATLLGTSFGVFEAYLARLLIRESARGQETRVVTGLMIGRSGAVVAVLAVGLVASSSVLASRLFAGHVAAAVALPLFIALAAAQAVQRGAMTGRRDFAAIAVQLSADGLTRTVFVVILVWSGLDSVTTLALACIAAAALSLVAGGRKLGPWLATPRLRGREAAIGPLLYLLAGSVGPLLANNGSVPWLAATDSVDAYVLGAFAGAVTLSRIPTQFISAVFSPLMAHLSQAVEAGDERTFRHLRRRAEVLAAMLGALYVAAFAILGPWVLSVYLGPDYRLSRGVLAILAAASSGMFVIVVQQAGLAALDRWARIAFAWAFGTLAFVLVLVVPVDPLMRAALAPAAAVATALLAMSLLGRGLSSVPGRVPGAGS
ncbi:MAG: hypothetical protein WBQ50_11575 [Nocardioides sp.]